MQRRVVPFRPLNALEAGRAALARGAWQDAKRAFDSVLLREESPEALEGLALAAWWLDLADVVFSSREQAYRLYRERGDVTAAARVAVWIGWDYSAFRGEQAVANGWMQRAHQLLDGLADRPEHAWLAVREGVFALLEDSDPDRARALAADAIRIGRATGAVDFEMIGRALHGFVRVVAGEVADGMRELDGVNAAVLAGEIVDPVAIGLSCCYLVNACERVRDGDRAVQWCDRLKGFCTTWGLRPLLAVCRTQYASVCVWRGAWSEAEQELITATAELAASRPAMTAEGQARLGQLRRLQGRLDEAAELFDQAGHHPVASLGRAALAIDRGDPSRAADLTERYLRHLPKNDQTERAPGLELLVRASAETGSLERARTALAELQEIAMHAATAPLRASASFAAGWVAGAEGQADAARRHFEDAVDLFHGSGAPYETARARLELARVLGLLGRTAAARDELERTLCVLVEMNAAHDLARARRLERQLSPRPEEPAGRGRVGGLSRRELEVIRLIAAGLDNQAIAERLVISEHTVHRHVANILARLDVPSRSAAVARAAQLGLLTAG
ncbi:MAG TPA: LuxR C-terminal-related transcriptional regulator [Thermoanaerobaculia bacterium]|nr:LuxR C-terminal-related transcriptional regulator [Thermoanaerobaculia bacterium]